MEVVPTKPYSSQRDLSLAYSPGVAEPCLEIAQNEELVYEYTAKGNLVAVVSNGTAVLGLGNIGAAAGKPVMEGKGVLFKRFADVDVFDIELNTLDPDEVIKCVQLLEPTFGGINLEDIKAPECFYIEEELKRTMNIPVFHDDQHGTAIISGAALLNAVEVVGKKLDQIKVVFNGAGASAISCAKLYVALGVKTENIIICDTKGVVFKGRKEGMNKYKEIFANDTKARTLQEAMVGTDVFVGLSSGNCVSKDMIRSMANDPIVFAMANPNPEISYEDAISAREDIIFATGRSDHPNQINNVLGFPYIFRGALDVRATCINEEMKLAAVYALAELAKKPVPDVVNAAYNLKRLSFGRDYIIPKPLDPRLLTIVAPAVARAAMESGVARKRITDWAGYNAKLRETMGYDDKMLRSFYETARQNPKRVVFSEANHLNMLKAAEMAYNEGVCFPVLLGNEEKINSIAREYNIDLSG
ncbi:MAG TPA: phosphate acyltransferase, partial [Tenuifilaceae bacterium]|nr:phosphate acyltransferase [Tenuifilaceae bacterium]